MVARLEATGRLPVVVVPGGASLLAPSTSELAERVGLQTRAGPLR